MSPRRMLEIVRASEGDELLAHFPEFREGYDEVRGRLDALVLELETAYERIRHIEGPREFAAEASSSRCPAALFAVRNGKASGFRAFLASATIQSVERSLGMKQPPGE